MGHPSIETVVMDYCMLAFFIISMKVQVGGVTFRKNSEHRMGPLVVKDGVRSYGAPIKWLYTWVSLGVISPRNI